MLPLHLGFHIVVNLIRLRYDRCDYQNNQREKGSAFPVHGLFCSFHLYVCFASCGIRLQLTVGMGAAAAVLHPAISGC
jgi:hypothetical protein